TSALEQSPLLDATLRESQRLWPVFPIVARKLLKPLQISGYDLPEGTRVVPCLYLSHRRPESFPEPHRFLPERFLNGRALPASMYFPFGGGLRRCPGADLALHEMKLMLGTLLSRLSLMHTGTLSPEKGLRPAWRFFSLAPENGLPVVITDRRP